MLPMASGPVHTAALLGEVTDSERIQLVMCLIEIHVLHAQNGQNESPPTGSLH